MIALPFITRNITHSRSHMGIGKYHDSSLTSYLQSEQYRQKQRLLDEKIKKLYNYGHDQEISERVIPKVNERGDLNYSQVDNSFKTAVITSEARRKGDCISKRIKELSNMPLEIYLYSLDNLNSTDGPITRDLYIAKEQTVTSVACDVPPMGVLKSKLDIKEKLKKRVIGWSHSHGRSNPFFSRSKDSDISDVENTINILNLHGLTKRVRVYDHTYRGEGYKGVEYEVRYTPAIVFNALNAQPFVAVAVEYTRRYDEQKVFHINENCELRVIEENNDIDMDPKSIDRQILERVTYLGKKLQVREDISPIPPITQSREKVSEELPLTERVMKLERAYAQLEQRFAIRNRRLRALYKRLKSRYNTLKTEHEQSRETLKVHATRIEELKAHPHFSYAKRLISKLKRTNPRK